MMARLTVFCVLLFCVFGTTMAIKNPFHFIWKPNHCVEVYPANCFDICGKGHCLNRYKCCHRIFSFLDTFCEDKQELQRLCLPFVCKNNGTLLRTQDGHGYGYDHRALSRCDAPTLKCACPTGYSGTCCQSRTSYKNPCSTKKCSVGKCVVIYGRAVCKSKGRPSIDNTEAPTDFSFETSRPSDFFHETVNPDIVTKDTVFTTGDTFFTTEDTVVTDRTTEDTAFATEDTVFTTGDTVFTTEDTVVTDRTTEDTAFATEDTVFTTEDTVVTDRTTEDTAFATEDTVFTTEDTVVTDRTTEDTLFTTEDTVFTDGTRDIELEATSFVDETGNPDISTDSATEEAVTDEPAPIY
ncbi:uncharacterized protein LOC134193882 [Corticium candelabrum]|uniref:uncharacterized protein LOC134193882 n=1 Tax=Corticium candelabrum TaxID=121492 RepID=UPI002E266931|nr:uncharacterized protein LOC134193882 [Corticium candelabrum]